jgi:GDP-4-dehydro-6-deoxy-D-mannose reductase
MRVLVTGANGFVGRHLVRELSAGGHRPILLDRQPEPFCVGLDYVQGDILDGEGLRSALAAWKPDGCIHLAGIAFVPAADRAPAEAFRVNAVGTLQVLEAFRRHDPDSRVLCVSTAHVYGLPGQPGLPIAEVHPLSPHTLYGASKAAADQGTLLFARRHGFAAFTARPSNHLGPGQAETFAAAAFAAQAAAIRRGDHEPVMRVGNLDSRREFLDVRDVVSAYRLLLEAATPGEAYNVGTGALLPVRELLDLMCAEAGIRPRLEVDPKLFRATDDGPLLACDKIRRAVDWAPTLSLRTTVADILRETA